MRTVGCRNRRGTQHVIRSAALAQPLVLDLRRMHGHGGGLLERDQRALQVGMQRKLVLPRPHVDLADHAHLQVLGRRDMAMPEVGSGVRREVVVREAATHVDRKRRVRHAVVERRGIRITVEVNRVLLEKVGPHDLADVGEGEKELVVFVDRHERCRHVRVHHADVHGEPWVDVPVERGAGSVVGQLRIRCEADRAVERKCRNSFGCIAW